VCMGNGEQVADGARPHALLLAMVALVAVVALDLPMQINRRDAVLADEMLLDRPGGWKKTDSAPRWVHST
jgi:hypothetical protein